MPTASGALIPVLLPDRRYKFGKLVDLAPVRRLPSAPLLAIDGTKIAIRVSPFIPDRNAIFLQIADIGIAADEPEQFVKDRACVELLRRQQGKPASRSNRIW